MRGISARWLVFAAVLLAALVGVGLFSSLRDGSALDAASAAPSPSATSEPTLGPATEDSAAPEPHASEPASAKPVEEPAAAAKPSEPAVTTVNGVSLPDPQVAPPVEFDEPAAIVPDFTARVVATEAIEGVAQGIGEISGPALKVTLELANNTRAPLETVGVSVNLYGDGGIPTIPLLGDPNHRPLPDTVAPGQVVRGVYVFNVPVAQRDNMTLTLAFDPAKPTVVFVGKP